MEQGWKGRCDGGRKGRQYEECNGGPWCTPDAGRGCGKAFKVMKAREDIAKKARKQKAEDVGGQGGPKRHAEEGTHRLPRWSQG